MDIIELHRRAVTRFGEHVDTVGPDQWAAPTPCSEWDVRALVNHVTGEDLWTAPLLAGATVAEVGNRYDGDLLAPDPPAAYWQAAAAAMAAVAADGALARTTHLSSGDAPGEEYVWQVFADHLIHGWDLARAIGADDRLDPELVDACARWFARYEELYRDGGVVGPRPQVAPDADPQRQLLAAFGRTASAPAGDS